MSFEFALAVVAIAALANIALVAVRGDPLPIPFRRATRTSTTTGDDHEPEDAASADPELRPAAVQRVVRVATWLFLFAATTIVSASGLWPERQGMVLGLLAFGAMYQLLLHDVLAARVPEVLLHASEGALAIAFAGFLVGLTGGTSSPFFFAFPLIAGGAAVLVAPSAALVLTGSAAATYLVAVAGADGLPLTTTSLAAIAVNLIALTLLAYVGVAIGREQAHAREHAFRLATVDTLTGLRTRAHLFNAMERELIRSERTRRSFCLLMLDLDDLKRVNDQHGHLVGDAALKAAGEVIGAGIRRIDTGARYGGDEFVVLLPETDATGGWVLAEKIRRDVADLRLTASGRRVAMSVSVGLVTFPSDGDTIGELLERADSAMYESKRSGRDRVTGVPVMDPDARRTGVPGRPV